MLLFLVANTVHAGFFEDFGDHVSGPSGCDAAWVDYCEGAWTALNESDSSELCEADSAPFDIGVLIEGSPGPWPNGIRRTTSVSSGYFRAVVDLYAMDAIDAGLRLEFLSSSGTVLGSHYITEAVPATRHTKLIHTRKVPATAVAVRVSIGILGNGFAFVDDVTTYQPGVGFDQHGGIVEGMACVPDECTRWANDHCAANPPCAGETPDCPTGTMTPSCVGLCTGAGPEDFCAIIPKCFKQGCPNSFDCSVD